MDDIRHHILHAACAACASIASPAECAHAAIVHQPVQWSVPADGQALVIDGARLHGGSGTAAIRTVAEIPWQDTPGLGVQGVHVPAAGPLVLLGIAALVGGPRRGRPAHGTHPVNPA